MQQPQVARRGRALAWLVIAVALALPALSIGWNVWATGAFLGEFLTEGRLPLLSAVTPTPRRAPLETGAGAADLYEPLALLPPPALVLVHGLAPQGKDDPRLVQAARLLARAGFRVAVPTIPGLTRLRLRPGDAEPVVAAIRALGSRSGRQTVGVLGVSVGAGPALLAAADPRVAGRVGAVLSLGGYASAAELLRYFLTGAYGYGGAAGRVPPQPEAARLFLRSNLDLVANAADRRALDGWLADPTARPPTGLSPAGEAVLRLVQNRDPDKVDELLRQLPPGLGTLLARLSPESVLPRLRARLFLVHGRGDPAVPFTETLRLADAAVAAGIRTRTVIVGVLAHVEPGEGEPGVGAARPVELGRLWALLLALRATS